MDAYVACVAGAVTKGDYLTSIRSAGFLAIKLLEERPVNDIFPRRDPMIQKLIRFLPLPEKTVMQLSGYYAESITVRAMKPGGRVTA